MSARRRCVWYIDEHLVADKRKRLQRASRSMCQSFLHCWISFTPSIVYLLLLFTLHVGPSSVASSLLPGTTSLIAHGSVLHRHQSDLIALRPALFSNHIAAHCRVILANWHPSRDLTCIARSFGVHHDSTTSDASLTTKPTQPPRRSMTEGQ
jgi:hypothetical protein